MSGVGFKLQGIGNPKKRTLCKLCSAKRGYMGLHVSIKSLPDSHERPGVSGSTAECFNSYSRTRPAEGLLEDSGYL